MKLSAAEKQARYRARRDADPVKREAYLQKGRKKWREISEKGKVKTIKDLTEREKRSQRKFWRNSQEQSRRRKKLLKSLNTPPQSPEASLQPETSRLDERQNNKL